MIATVRAFAAALALLLAVVLPASASTATVDAAPRSPGICPVDEEFRGSQVHSYFVAAREGAPAVWVHNTSDPTQAMVRSSGAPEVLTAEMSGAGAPLPGTRETGIQRAWRQEVDLVQKTGAGTATWTPDEIAKIKGGAGFRELGYTGHHINRVHDYPQWAGDPRNIAFLKQGSGESHMATGHPGGTRAKQPPGSLIDRQAMLKKSGC